MIQSRKSMFFVCVTVGLVLLASKYRNNVLRRVKQICRSIKKKCNDEDDNKKNNNKREEVDDSRELKVSFDRIILADSPELCDYAVQRIRCDLSEGVLGFDCEWVNEGAVSLLQLATFNGTCALFRLCKIGYVPPTLKELLTNQNLLKVGVATFEDSVKITRDYKCEVVGTVDLRKIASHYSLPNPKSLAALSVHYLGIQLNKDIEVRCSNWDADTLTDQQINYAANDAWASVLIYRKMMRKVKQKQTLWATFVLFVKQLAFDSQDQKCFDVPNELVDAKFKAISEAAIKRNIFVNNNNNKIGEIINRHNTTDYRSSVPARNKPLYHNCYLEAPDGETLCTCDRKKAEWYVTRSLGDVVKEDPFTVRLKFEPSGRASGQVGKYYLQVKVNQCVVCGAADKFIRKNVIPREYRKYFPLVMKSHQSHDVVLLCPACHEISNLQDLPLRKKLADMCDAPLGPVQYTRTETNNESCMLLSAVKALRNRNGIPQERRKELELYIMKCTGSNQVTPVLLNVLHEQLKMKQEKKNKSFINHQKKNAPNSQEKNLPHGQKVVQCFENNKGGLVELERLWREHFLSTMKPKFLPELWSVRHNQERLTIRQHENRIDPLDAKVAGITT